MSDKREFLETLKEDLMNDFDQTYGSAVRVDSIFYGVEKPKNPDESKFDFNKEEYGNWKYEIVVCPEYEGGASYQDLIVKFVSLEEDDVIHICFPLTWVSWDGMDYEDSLIGAKVVKPVEKIVYDYEVDDS